MHHQVSVPVRAQRPQHSATELDAACLISWAERQPNVEDMNRAVQTTPAESKGGAAL